jgi:ribosomal protein S12 methylthiotransferase
MRFVNTGSSNSRPLRVGMISLGCAKNLVDAEIMIGTLVRDGIQIINDAAQADVLIVNTCSFIDAAQEESVDAILESTELREASNRGQGLVVSGCLPQRYRKEIASLLPEVDAFIGLDQVPEISRIVRRAHESRAARLKNQNAPITKASRASASAHSSSPEPLVSINPRSKYIPDYSTPRFRLTPAHYAYVKIAEGCNHPCSFCAIPQIRGSHRSRPQSDIVAEARQLIAEGVKELNLISQDTTYYGLDLRPVRNGEIAAPDKFRAAAASLPADTPTLCSLIEELNALPGDFWIRLLYTHPAHWTDQLIQTIVRCSKVARYVDMPLQHVHGNMLERMRRETSREYISNLIDRIRTAIPGIALRTTFIVGFPGESQACFETLIQSIREFRFERLGIFTYSPEAGTRAAKMLGQVPDAEKKRRRSEAMAVQSTIASEISSSFLGRELKVLVEHDSSSRDLKKARLRSWEHNGDGLTHNRFDSGKLVIARSEADAPDIDGRIYIRGKLRPGEFAKVKVISHSDYDLMAEPV